MKVQRVLGFTVGLGLVVNFGFAQQRSIDKPVPAPAAPNTPPVQNFSTNADLQVRARELLRQEVAETVAKSDDVDDEIRGLFEALGN